ncbi:glycosyltransferase family 4 protein [Cytobacillus firmus]|uniref:glycosyltransferase family 4 protein n=1 Tax=Cytobacillus firmus TaxID=1399 RepID=UPI0021637E21|nr:glycosyltransferase family 4 protein [Cytobacillus firmus]MCS0674068.1 glycosyltransferase family 4 protein [Cytobacillus firmus]
MESRRPRLVTLFPETENIHLLKDVGMIPYILQKYYNYDSKIVCYDNGDYPYLRELTKGLKIEILEKSKRKRVKDPYEASIDDGYNYIKRHAKQIDILQIFHLSDRSLPWISLYKLLNPKGKVYLKLDANADAKNIKLHESVISILRLCNLISVETKELYEYLNQHWPLRIEYLPNGFYDFGVRENILFEEKENIICSAGSIGSHIKGHDLLIEAFCLAYPYIPGWKLKLIGSVDNPLFHTYLSEYFERNPHLKDKIIFTGKITDRPKLENEYRKAKIFCLPSRSEGFPLVFPEAGRNGCFIISSNVIPAWDITDNKRLGDIVEINNIHQLADSLIKNCNHEERLREGCKGIQDHMYNNFYWVNICQKIDSLLNL